MEINNGRLAMIGLMSLCAESSYEGSVPFLTGKIGHYSGNMCVPFGVCVFSSDF